MEIVPKAAVPVKLRVSRLPPTPLRATSSSVSPVVPVLTSKSSVVISALKPVPVMIMFVFGLVAPVKTREAVAIVGGGETVKDRVLLAADGATVKAEVLA
jgi:hypothetical protein